MRTIRLSTALLAFSMPLAAMAADGSGLSPTLRLQLFLTLSTGAILLVLVVRMIVGMLNWKRIDEMQLDMVERSHPYLLGTQLFLWIGICAILFGFFMTEPYILKGVISAEHASSWILLFALFGFLTMVIRVHAGNVFFERIYAAVIGSVTAVLLLSLVHVLLSSASGHPFVLVGLLCAFVGLWRFLFSSWREDIRAIVMLSFIFWLTMEMLLQQNPAERFTLLVAIGVASLPAILWFIFIGTRQASARWSQALLFCSGMLATIPALILIYLQQRGMDIHAFFADVRVLNVFDSSRAFVSSFGGSVLSQNHMLIAMTIAFILSAIIEEVSKLWVLKHGIAGLSIGKLDIIRGAALIGIGFALAENILNPDFFPSFVREQPTSPTFGEWVFFARRVFGRSLLSTAAHVLATVTAGFFLVYASKPAEKEESLIIRIPAWFLSLPASSLRKPIFMTLAILLAVIMHTTYNVVSMLPTVMPHFPTNAAELLQVQAVSNVLRSIQLGQVLLVVLLLTGVMYIRHLLSYAERIRSAVVQEQQARTAVRNEKGENV